MKQITHLIWSFGISLLLFMFIFKINFFFTLLFSFLVGFLSFLPDIDIKIINKIDKFNFKTFYVFWIFNYPLKLFFKHRTITHSIWFPLLFFCLGEFVFSEFILVSYSLRILYLALILHIFEDSLTVSGVELFFPFNFNFKLAKFSTDSFFDYWILNLIGFIFIFVFKYILCEKS